MSVISEVNKLKDAWCDECHGYAHAPWCPSCKQPSHEQPASAKAGESEQWFMVVSPIHGHNVTNGKGREIATGIYREEDAMQIVSDHNQHQHCATQLQFLANRAEELSSLLAGMTTERDGLREALRRLAQTGRGALPLDEYRDWVKEVATTALNEQKGA